MFKFDAALKWTMATIGHNDDLVYAIGWKSGTSGYENLIFLKTRLSNGLQTIDGFLSVPLDTTFTAEFADKAWTLKSMQIVLTGDVYAIYDHSPYSSSLIFFKKVVPNSIKLSKILFDATVALRVDDFYMDRADACYISGYEAINSKYFFVI